ncbi:PilZ domain-containing protein [Myxococcota bacterium]
MTKPKSKIRAPRYAVGLTVVCDSDHGVWSGIVVDMSESGVFVQTDETLPVGARATLVPQVEDDAQLPAEMRAVVVRVDDVGLEGTRAAAGLAFRLVGLSVQHFAQVRAYLRGHGDRTTGVGDKRGLKASDTAKAKSNTPDSKSDSPRLSVVCESEHGVWSGRVIAMTESGLFVQTEEVVEAGAAVTLVPQVEDDTQLPAEMGAVVVSAGKLAVKGGGRPSGIAFRLVGLSDEEVEQVREYVRHRGKP